MHVALYDYEARTASCLSIRAGEQLVLEGEEIGGWQKARNRDTNQEGYIPCNYVAELKSLEAEP